MQLFNPLLLQIQQMFTLFSIFIGKKVFVNTNDITLQSICQVLYRQKKGWWVYSLSIGNNLSQILNLSLFKPCSRTNEFPMFRNDLFSVLYCCQIVVLVIASSGSFGFLKENMFLGQIKMESFRLKDPDSGRA